MSRPHYDHIEAAARVMMAIEAMKRLQSQSKTVYDEVTIERTIWDLHDVFEHIKSEAFPNVTGLRSGAV